MIAPVTLAEANPRFPLPLISLILLLGAIVRRCWLLREAARPTIAKISLNQQVTD
jgi:hypothetical protein